MSAEKIIMEMSLGPCESEWTREPTTGDCPECGGQCAPECGRHPLGCIFGGHDGYWMIAEGCKLFHGETNDNASSRG
jgi:hypothetical protein